jgi:pimeloyl-ACP methyl ester carboxylesterase
MSIGNGDIKSKRTNRPKELRDASARGDQHRTFSHRRRHRANICFYKEMQSYFRSARTPTLLLWGELDQYLSGAANTCKRDLPEAEVAPMKGRHWLLETHSNEVNETVRKFLLSVF